MHWLYQYCVSLVRRRVIMYRGCFLIKQKQFKFVVIVCMCILVLFVFSFNFGKFNEHFGQDKFEIRDGRIDHSYIVEKYYEKRQNLQTSNLGSILFKNEQSKSDITNKTFVILIWKQWDWLKNRHVYNFGTEEQDPLDGCSVRNCRFTGDDKLLASADSVVVHLQRGLIPDITNRNPRQRWIFLNDESPLHSFTLAVKPPKLSDLYNVFNWSMTYRTDADVPVPYGRTLPLSEPVFADTSAENIIQLIPNYEQKRRDVLATILISNCGVSYRMKFVNELKKYIKVDVHGGCADKAHVKSCPGHFRSDCKIISQYLFYLVLENSMCREYITEKIFHQAYAKGAIPVIMGPPLEDCERLLPPNSFLHVNNFKTTRHLAEEIVAISKDAEKLVSYHNWRNDFVVSNEHGYFGSKSYHFCRLCEAMNYNDEAMSIYDETKIKTFFDPKETCIIK